MACGATAPTKPGSRLELFDGKVNGKQICNNMRDGGCNTVVVKTSLVNKNQYTGKWDNLTTINSTVLTLPTANIHIDTPYYTGSVEAIVMDNPIYPLVLGNIKELDVEQREETTKVVTASAEDWSEPKFSSVLSGVSVPIVELAKFQKEDTELDIYWNHAKSGQERYTKQGRISWMVRDGVLHRRFMTSTATSDHVDEQVVVPAQLRDRVLQQARQLKERNEWGFWKTFRTVTSTCWWPEVSKDLSTLN